MKKHTEGQKNMERRFAILSGTSCVGKGPLQSAVKKLYPGLIDARPVLCTSRGPRDGEKQGDQFYFLPEGFIRSLEKSKDFAVSPVRTDWQAIFLPQVEELLDSNDLVFAEVFYAFGPALMERVTASSFKSIRIFLTPLPFETPQDEIIKEVRGKLDRRGTDSHEKKEDRSEWAPREMAKASSYTHTLLNPAGEDDIDEWKCFGTRNNTHGAVNVDTIEDLGANAQWLVKTFVGILKGGVPEGHYERTDA